MVAGFGDRERDGACLLSSYHMFDSERCTMGSVSTGK